ncbi:MAG: hypothetical protein KatS3mg003_1051 [Candidatus Nitrosocaldaceae archaeon]|nr:MAG: hypothetical protein KatS3mg003_1051 [Candidatus Nitrosocaldaceae archaeon]
MKLNIRKIFGNNNKGDARGVDLTTIYYGTSSDVTNKDLLDLYLNEPTIRSNIDFVVDEILNDKIVADKELINKTIKNWDLNLNNVTKELLIFGYSIQYVNREARRLESIRMSNVSAIIHDNNGTPIKFRYAGKEYEFNEDYILITLPSVDVIIDNKLSWLYPLLVTHTISINNKSYSFSVYDLYKTNLYYMLKSFKDNISSKNIILVEDRVDVKTLKDSLDDAKTRDSIIMNGVKDIKTLKGSSDPSAIDLIEKAQEIITLVTNNSFNLLLLKQSFTEASAKVTKQMVEKRLQSLKTSILSCVKTILQNLGHQNFTLRFVEDKQFEIDQLSKLVMLKIITPEEARKLIGIDEVLE